MDMGMGGGDSSSSTPLNASGVDFSNETQAFNFLQDILDDTFLQVDGNRAATRFWYGIVVAVGLATMCNLVWSATLRARLRASQANRPRPAKPRNPFTKCVATTTAILREATYLQITPTKAAFWVKLPPFGSMLIIATYFAFILALEFINNDVTGAQYWQALSFRAAWLAVAQMPLIVLLAGKNNLVGLLSGVSYERLNVYHRWVARGLLLLATFHFAFESHGWDVYGLMQLEWATDTCPLTGIAAYAILLWMNLTTLAPMRHLSYDFFVAQHIITFFGFIIAIMMHLPTTALYSRVYIYIPIGLYLMDRVVRTARYIVNNIRPGRATLEALDGGATRIRVSNCRVKKWAPGSHVLLAIPHYGVAQSHPATIMSTPSSHNGDLVFILRAHKGFTRRILKAVEEDNIPSRETRLALVDGPYGAGQANFVCFDTVYLIAGGTGVSFTMSILLGIADQASTSRKLPLRVVRFIWIVKKRTWLSWIVRELQSAFKKLRAAGIEAQIQIFVTCDDSLTDVSVPKSQCGSQPQGACTCCVISGEDKLDPTSQDDGHVGANSVLSLATLQPGRPVFDADFWDTLCRAEGETAIGVCGPLGLSTSVRSAVVKVSDERAVHKGTGAQGMYLHVETFH